MIIAVAIDPFTQQLLTYVDCSVVLDDTIATLPRTNCFVGNGYVIGDNASIGLQALDETIEAGIQASVLAGFFGTPYTPVPECPSGNCTFSSFTTVGFCSKCEDVSDSIMFVNETCWDDNGKVEPCSVNMRHSRFTSQLPEALDMGVGGLSNLSITWDSDSFDNPAVATSTVIDSELNASKALFHTRLQR